MNPALLIATCAVAAFAFGAGRGVGEMIYSERKRKRKMINDEKQITISEAVATLVVAQLDSLANGRCCSRCCAPCDVIRRLAARSGGQTLDSIIQWAPPDLIAGSSWLTPTGTVDREWLAAQWACQNNPRCEHDDADLGIDVQGLLADLGERARKNPRTENPDGATT